MNRKEKFVMFVYLAAIAKDSASKTTDAARIAVHAARIRETAIPLNTINASQVFVSYCHGKSRPFKWMRKTG